MNRILYILFLFCFIGHSQVRYVTATASGSGDGLTEGTAWTPSQAFANDAPGMTIYVKAGNYGSSQWFLNTSGTSGSPIKYIGYTSTAGDITASNGSTWSIGDTTNASIAPLVDGTNYTGTGISITGKYVELHNFQVRDYLKGIDVSGAAGNNVINNVFGFAFGDQTCDCTGTGIDIFASNVTVQNSLIHNAGGYGVRMWNSDNSLMSYVEIYANNVVNPGGYYLLLTGGTENTIIENCYIERTAGLAHGGHGYILKAGASNNIIRNSTAKFTNVELNFTDVTNNVIENMRLIGQSTSASDWHTNVDIRNGANNNTLKNFYITDTHTAVQFIDFDDGYTPSPDTDAVNCGYSNNLYNFVIERTTNVLVANGNTNLGGSNNAPFNDNVFDGWVVDDFSTLSVISQPNSGNTFKNSIFTNGSLQGAVGGGGHSNNIAYSENLFFNNVFSPPSGTDNATGNPLFVNTGGGALDYQLQSGSPAIDTGVNTLNDSDYLGNSRPFNVTMDKGAFEFDSGTTNPPGDTTAPSVGNVTIYDITEQDAKVSFSIDEGSYFSLFYDTNTGSSTLSGDELTIVDYPLETFKYTAGYVVNVITSIGNSPSGVNPYLSPSTQYFFRIRTEDAAGNVGVSNEFNFTTEAGAPPPVPGPAPEGVRMKFSRSKKGM